METSPIRHQSNEELANSWVIIFVSPLNCKEIKPINPKRNQSWIPIERTDAEAEAPILRPPEAKSQLIGKDPDVGKDWRQEKGTTEDEMVGWHHGLNEHEFEQTLRDSGGQRSLVCCSPWGCKESDMIEWLHNNFCGITLWKGWVHARTSPGQVSQEKLGCQNPWNSAQAIQALQNTWGILKELPCQIMPTWQREGTICPATFKPWYG